MSSGLSLGFRLPAAAALVALALSAGAASAQERSRSEPFPCDVQTSERVVAIGDVHGAYDAFVAILRAAGLIDGRNRWSGGRSILVQTGDVLDRGADSRKVIDLLRRLEKDAPRAGGRVYALLGNHEWMRVTVDFRFVSEGELKAFRTSDSSDLREHALKLLTEEAAERERKAGRTFDASVYRERLAAALPLGNLEMRAAFEADGNYGAWVRSRPALARINGVLFLHGGISPETAALGCERVNASVRENLEALPAAADRVAAMFASSETGPLWYRGLAQEPEAQFAPALDDILARMQARAIVIGHTVAPGRITPRFGGRVIQIDTGMLNGTFYPGGAPAALELKGDTATAIYLDRRVPLPSLPEAAVTAGAR